MQALIEFGKAQIKMAHLPIGAKATSSPVRTASRNASPVRSTEAISKEAMSLGKDNVNVKTIKDLPPELILEISQYYLPIVDRGNFAMSERRQYDIFSKSDILRGSNKYFCAYYKLSRSAEESDRSKACALFANVGSSNFIPDEQAALFDSIASLETNNLEPIGAAFVGLHKKYQTPERFEESVAYVCGGELSDGTKVQGRKESEIAESMQGIGEAFAKGDERVRTLERFKNLWTQVFGGRRSEGRQVLPLTERNQAKACMGLAIAATGLKSYEIPEIYLDMRARVFGGRLSSGEECACFRWASDQATAVPALGVLIAACPEHLRLEYYNDLYDRVFYSVANPNLTIAHDIPEIEGLLESCNRAKAMRGLGIAFAAVPERSVQLYDNLRTRVFGGQLSNGTAIPEMEEARDCTAALPALALAAVSLEQPKNEMFQRYGYLIARGREMCSRLAESDFPEEAPLELATNVQAAVAIVFSGLVRNHFVTDEEASIHYNKDILKPIFGSPFKDGVTVRQEEEPGLFAELRAKLPNQGDYTLEHQGMLIGLRAKSALPESHGSQQAVRNQAQEEMENFNSIHVASKSSLDGMALVTASKNGRPQAATGSLVEEFEISANNLPQVISQRLQEGKENPGIAPSYFPDAVPAIKIAFNGLPDSQRTPERRKDFATILHGGQLSSGTKIPSGSESRLIPYLLVNDFFALYNPLSIGDTKRLESSEEVLVASPFPTLSREPSSPFEGAASTRALSEMSWAPESTHDDIQRAESSDSGILRSAAQGHGSLASSSASIPEKTSPQAERYSLVQLRTSSPTASPSVSPAHISEHEEGLTRFPTPAPLMHPTGDLVMDSPALSLSSQAISGNLRNSPTLEAAGTLLLFSKSGPRIIEPVYAGNQGHHAAGERDFQLPDELDPKFLFRGVTQRESNVREEYKGDVFSLPVPFPVGEETPERSVGGFIPAMNSRGGSEVPARITGPSAPLQGSERSEGPFPSRSLLGEAMDLSSSEVGSSPRAITSSPGNGDEDLTS